MKQALALCLLAFSCVTYAQEKRATLHGEEIPKAFATKVAGNIIDVFAVDYKMEEGQRFEARYIFDIARNHCLNQGTGTRLISHEPAFFSAKTGTIAGSLFRYRCGR